MLRLKSYKCENCFKKFISSMSYFRQYHGDMCCTPACAFEARKKYKELGLLK